MEVKIENTDSKNTDYNKFEYVDLKRLKDGLLKYRSLNFTINECGNIWQNHSWFLQASWLFFTDNNILHDIEQIEKDYEFISYDESKTI